MGRLGSRASRSLGFGGCRRARGRDRELMRRGDVVWVNLDPVRGSEAAKVRPAVVVSNDGANRTAEGLGRGVIAVVPVTSNAKIVYPFQVLLPEGSCGLPETSKAQAERVRSIPVERVLRVGGRLPSALLTQLDEALRLHLSLKLRSMAFRRRLRARSRGAGRELLPAAVRDLFRHRRNLRHRRQSNALEHSPTFHSSATHSRRVTALSVNATACCTSSPSHRGSAAWPDVGQGLSPAHPDG